jgi:hypothetical protein
MYASLYAYVGSFMFAHIFINDGGLKNQGSSIFHQQNPQVIDISILRQRLKKVSPEMSCGSERTSGLVSMMMKD